MGRKYRLGAVLFCVLSTMSVALSCVSITYVSGPAAASDVRADYYPAAANPTITDIVGKVSLGKIYNCVYDLQNFTNRDAKSPGAVNAATYLHNRLASYSGLTVSYDPFDLEGTATKNVIAVIPGLNKSNPKQYIISGHYDSYSDNPTNKPGADDDASGTAVAIEAARVLASYRFDATVVFAAWNAEEYGLVGAGAYARNASEHNVDVGGMMQFDMVGNDANKADTLYKLNVCAFDEYRWMWTAMSDANTLYSCGLTLSDAGPSGGSDHLPFYEYGYPSIMCIEKDFSPYYHKATDTIDKLNPELMTRTTKMGIATLAQMAGVCTPDEGSIFLNEVAYQPNDNAEITVYDSDMSASTLTISIKSTTEGTPESVTLTKTGNGVYIGTIPIEDKAPSTADGKLQVKNFDTVTAEYADTSPAKTAVVKARIDGSEPAVWGVAARPGITDATITWSTGEEANSTVLYGTATPVMKEENLKLVTEHSMRISGLTPATDYVFDLACTDIAGNTILEDNGGTHFGFRTLTGTASNPGYGYVYWVRESTSVPGGQSPHFDGIIRTGWGSESLTTYGAIQFNLSALPGGATITNATMSLYALGWLNPEDSGDQWSAKVLTSAIDSGWSTHKWPNIDAAVVESTLPPTYPDTALEEKIWNDFYFNTPSLITQLNTHITAGKISIRTQRDGGSTNHLFAWDAGVGADSKGPQYAPTLGILYTTVGDTTGPVVSSMKTSPDPTAGSHFANLTATITDDKSRVLYAEWFWGTGDPGLGKGYPTSPLGGTMDTKVINISHQIDVSTFSNGDFTISLRGMDESGNWGAVGTVVLHVTGGVVPEPVLLILPGLSVIAIIALITTRSKRD